MPHSNSTDLNSNSDVATWNDAYVLAGPHTLVDLPLEERFSDATRHVPLLGIGVRCADGTVPQHGTDVYRHRWSSPIDISGVNDNIEPLAGQFFYGGVIGPQFGHVLTQSLGRLWALEGDVPILYIPANHGFSVLPNYFLSLLKILGVHNPVLLQKQPCQVTQLILAKDHCNLERRPPISPIFSKWLAQRRPNVSVQDELSIYVSRAGLGLVNGQYLQEVALENALRAQGYQVIYPETLSIQDQVDLYLRAKRLIFADGSAVHLWSLFAHPDQLAAMICRRALWPKMPRWFRHFPDAKLQFLDYRLATFTGMTRVLNQVRGGNSSVALLDMGQIWDELAARGFHQAKQNDFPSAPELATWLQDIAKGEDALSCAPFVLDAQSRALLESRRRLVGLV